MSLFADKEQTVVIHHQSWPPDQKVYILRDMPYGARREIEAAMFSVRAGKNGEIDAKAELSAMKMETLRQMIASWTLTDHDGQPVPVTVENIDNLKAPVADYIYQQIGRLNPQLSEDEQSDFSSEPAPGSVDVVALPKRRSS